MSKFAFSLQAQGYSTQEVDKYIQSLQEEYRNAVEWSKQIEAGSVPSQQVDELKIKVSQLETDNTALKDENAKLVGDCKILAAKLRELIQSSSDTELAGATASDIIKDAKEKALSAVRNAEQKAKSILEKVEKECDSIILDATKEIDETKKELSLLDEQRSSLSAEIERLTAIKNDMTQKIEQAKRLLDDRY